MSGTLFIPAGQAAGDGFDLVVTPETAGWGYSSLRILTLAPGAEFEFGTADEEIIVLPLSGAARVAVGPEAFELAGRSSVFESVSDFAYLPIGATAIITSAAGGRFALTGARATRALPFRYGPAESVPVELRGAGVCSRQVNNFATPGVFDTDKLIGVEVLTPAANWSSYPPHKHDESTDVESELEEIYYYEFRSVAPAAATAAHAARSVGFQRVYGTGDRPIDVLEEVSDGDVVLVPHGWHGPAMASPSHNMYYLNVMAGPEPTRAWKIIDDPAHGWVRGTWEGQPVDSRLPFYRAAGTD